MPLVPHTKSGTEPRKWIGHLLQIYKDMKINHGPFFRTESGERMKLRGMATFLLLHLEKVQLVHPDLIATDGDVEEVYGVSRSLHRGSTSRATDMGLSNVIASRIYTSW